MSRPRQLIVRRSAIHGRGIFAAVDLDAHVQLIEYKGRRLTHAQADEQYSGSVTTGHTFLFTLNELYLIDANVGGNSARWINHSCEPNCEAMIYVNKDYRQELDKVWIETIRPVKAGEELCYNYGITLSEPHTARLKKIWACHCGAARCTGTLLQPKPRLR